MIQREVSLHVCSHFLFYMNYQQHPVFWELILIQLAPMLLFPKWHYWYKWQSLMIAQAAIFWVISISIFFEVVETVSSFPGPSTARGGQVIQLWRMKCKQQLSGGTWGNFSSCVSLSSFIAVLNTHTMMPEGEATILFHVEPLSLLVAPCSQTACCIKQTNKQSLTLL